MTTDTSTLKRDAINAFFAAEYEEYETCDLKYVEDDTFTFDGMGYMILTHDEADAKARERILDLLWAFNADFLVSHMPWVRFPSPKELNKFIECLKKVQVELCEDCNDMMLALLGDKLEKFVKDAIQGDGRGHFLSIYDGEETEFEYEDVMYYIYKND